MSGTEKAAYAALDDEAIVRRVREGDHQAFAALMERYHGLILIIAERVLGNRDDALEISQDVFLKLYQHVGTLKEPDRLKAWLSKVARNQALSVIRRRRHDTVQFCFGKAGRARGEADRLIRENRLSAADESELGELRARIREKVTCLTRDYEEIVRLYYLDGLSLPEIASRLGIPVGTAKWRLSQARNNLRKELIVAEESDALRNKSVVNPVLEVNIVWGRTGSRELRPEEVAKTLLAQQILLSVRKELKTARDIAKEVKADISYVNEHLAKMTEAELLEEQNDRYRANFILFDEDDMKRLKEELGEKGSPTAAAIARHADALSDAIAQLTPSAKGFDEDYLRWIILPTMVLNFGVQRKLGEAKGVVVKPPARPDGGNWYFKPSVVGVELPVELGCNVTFGRDGYAQYWNSDIGVTITRPSTVDMIIVRRLDKGPIGIDSLIDVFEEETVASVIDRGLARKDGGRVVATVPVFTPKDGDILDPVLRSILDDVVDQVYANYPDDVYAIFDSLGFSFIRSDYPAHAQEFAQLGAVRALVEKGVLAAPPSPAPLGWGFFAWKGTFAPTERPS